MPRKSRNDQPDSEYVKTTFIAHKFGVSRLTVVGWIEAGRFPGAIRPGTEYLVPRVDVEKLAAAGLPGARVAKPANEGEGVSVNP